MMTADLAFIGHIGPEALAAAALAVTLYLVSFTFGAGLVAPIAPLAAQSYGAGNLAMVHAHCARAYGRRCYDRSRSWRLRLVESKFCSFSVRPRRCAARSAISVWTGLVA